MIHTQVIQRYWNEARQSNESYETLLRYLREKKMLSWADTINVLRDIPGTNSDDAFNSNYNSLRKALWKNILFQENATYAEKRELSNLTFGDTEDYPSLIKVEQTRNFLYRDDAKRVSLDDGGRKYVLDTGEEFTWPGVTSIWGAVRPFDKRVWIKSLQRKHPDWDMDTIIKFMDDTRDNAAARGSAMHEAIETYLGNRNLFDLENDCDECGKPYLKNLMDMLRYDIDDVISIEPLVWWDLSEIARHKDAGAIGYIDLIGTHEGKTILYDWKTADKPKRREYLDNYFTQVSAYSAMVYQTYGIQIDEARICVAIKGAKAPQIFSLTRTMMRNYIQIFISNVREYCKQLDEFEKD